MTLKHRTRRPTPWSRAAVGLATLALVALVAACSSPRHRAPVESRSPVAAAPSASAPEGAASSPAGEATAAEIDSGPATFTVRPGDTLIRIGLETGQHWSDIARWNGLTNPNVLEVGQVLRVAPPPGETATVRPVTLSTPPEAKPLVTGPAASAASAAAPKPPSVTPVLPTPPTPAPSEGSEALAWQWPASGAVVKTFDDARNKGLAIAGKAGDPVLAAADGRVVYAGSGLRGYGNLIIIKHNNTFLSAYAHNQALLVKEDDVVRRGQRIAEMGSSDADRVQLHFEIRRLGKPVDPAAYLPSR